MIEEKKFTIHAQLHVKLTLEDIDDIMAGALEGGINYWCSKAEVVGDYLGEYGSQQIARGGELILHDAESEDKWKLNLPKFMNGVKLWIENGDDRYEAVNSNGTIDPCQIDGEMADMIIQYAIFGELIFG